MADHPKARNGADFIVRDMDGERLVYDLANQKVTALGPIAARVWDMCDGATSAPHILEGLKHGDHTVGDEDVAIALHRLGEAGLMIGAAPRRLDRRTMMRFASATGSALAVVSIISPTPAQAVSCNDIPGENCQCNDSSECEDPWFPVCHAHQCTDGGL